MLAQARTSSSILLPHEHSAFRHSSNLFVSRFSNQNQFDRFQLRVANRAGNSLGAIQPNIDQSGITNRNSLIQRWINKLTKPRDINSRHIPSVSSSIEASPAFEQSPIFCRQGWLFDLGAVDVNNDDIFDLFTTNHNATESLLIGSPSGKFTDTLSQWRLDQDRQFPGLGDFVFSPASKDKGLYIYRRNDTELYLHLQRGSEKGKALKPIQGQIVLPSPKNNKKPSVVVLRKHRANVKISEHPWRHGLQTHIQFKIRPNGWLVLNTRFSETLYSVQLDKLLPLNQIYVGARQVHPRSHKFTFHLHDRHGLAWADYQGDGNIDVFMSRGGLRGQILNFPTAPPIRDELFVNMDNGQFQDRASELGFEKQGCRARKVSWIDFNQDNRLDLYIGGLNSPNQLFRQQPNGHFINVAKRQGVNFSDSGTFEWLDVDNDNDSDLLIARKGKLSLYRNQTKRFNHYQTITIPETGVRKLTISDYDQDGDFDVYAASPQSSKLLNNIGGRFTAIDLTSLGLPTQALTANWVDYDNDGLIDLHTMPGKLYRQTPDHQFVATQLLNQDLPSWDAVSNNPKCNDNRSLWFDIDNNGTRDALCEVIQNGAGHATLYRNLLTQNHWLQLKLVGPKGNQQAIGAKVAVTTADSRQVQQVGQAEGSHYSQGHYRLYFGLGQQQGGGSIYITWPDGTPQQVTYSTPDQLLTVQYLKPN